MGADCVCLVCRLCSRVLWCCGVRATTGPPRTPKGVIMHTPAGTCGCCNKDVVLLQQLLLIHVVCRALNVKEAGAAGEACVWT